MKSVRASLLALVVCCFVAIAQEPPTAPPPTEAPAGPPVSTIKVPPPPMDPGAYRVSSEVELVLLDVAVKDSKGGFVSGLTKDKFKVFENRIEQPIRNFGAQDSPVTVGLIIDNSASIRPKKPEIITAALTFVTQSNPLDEVFVVNFNDSVYMGLPESVPFTGDRKLLREAMLHNAPQGRTALYDAIKTGLEHLEKGRLDKKTLIVISDGGDNASDLNRGELMKLAEQSLATIYTIGIFDADDKDKNPGFLRELAQITGGEAFIPESTDNLVGICEKIARDVRNRYSIGFAPGASHQHDGKPRHLRVLVTGDDGTKLEARTRTHYIPAAEATNTETRSRGKKK